MYDLKVCRQCGSIYKINLKSIAEELGIFGSYRVYEDISPAKKAWITIKANERGLNPASVHAGIKAALTRMRNGK